MSDNRKLDLFTRLKKEGVTVDGSQCFIRDWDVVRYIDRGTIGVVYEIVKRHQQYEERSALKIIELDEKSIEKFRSEIMALNSVRDHPHGVSLDEFSELHLDEGDFVRRYILIRMELLQPMPKTGMQEDDVIQMALDVSDVLADCHNQERKILHCDIKPQNILRTESGQFKLSDFGEAKFLDRSRGESGMHGTPLYMSPEMALFKGYDERSDLYSLGVTMYAMLNGGCVPFYSRDMGESGERKAIYRRLAGEKFPKIKGVRPELLRIIGKLCQLDPDKRYQHASQLNRDLKMIDSKKGDKASRKEKNEYTPSLREKKNEDEVNKRLEEILRREDERKSQEAREGELQTSQEEKQYGTLLLGETVAANRRELLNQAESVQYEASTKNRNLAANTTDKRRARIIAAFLGVILLAGAIFGVVSAVRYLKGTYPGDALAPATAADRVLARDFVFVRTADGCRLTKYTGEGDEVAVPDQYSGYPVVSLGSHVFANNTTVSEITIPDSVREIDDYAFYGCTELEKLDLPDSVSRIGVCALYGCSSLRSITIPGGVTEIKDKTFWGCGLNSISIPSSVTRIGDQAFYQCTGLYSVNIPDSVISLGDGVFSGCTSLSSVTIPESITRLGANTFSECINLSFVSLPDGLLSIGDGAFMNCDNLDEMILPNSVTEIGDSAFSNCSNLTSVVMPENVDSMGDSVFYWCEKLTSVIMPIRAAAIGDNMFWYCGELKSIIIPDGVTHIGDNAFVCCISLNSVTLPDGLVSIGDKAFNFCFDLKYITIPDSVKHIGANAFADGGLISVTVPDGVEHIGRNAFRCASVVVTAPYDVSYYGYTPGEYEHWQIKD